MIHETNRSLVEDLMDAVDNLTLQISRSWCARFLSWRRLPHLIRLAQIIGDRMERIEELAQLSIQTNLRGVGCGAIETTTTTQDFIRRYMKGAPRPVNLDIAARFRAFREGLGLGQGELAARLGVKPDSLSRWEKGGRTPAYENLAKIASQFPDLNMVWLLTGQGETFTGAAPDKIPQGDVRAELEAAMEGQAQEAQEHRRGHRPLKDDDQGDE